MPVPDLFTVAVDGGDLTVARWGPGGDIGNGSGPVVIGLHGITANHRSFAALARALADDGVTLVTPDLRGRGGSASVGPRSGMAAHADDVARVLDHLGATDAVVVGHSMGGFVAGALAVLHASRVRSLVFVDGGLPLPVPPGLDIDAVLAAVIGPAMQRLNMTFAGVEEYEAFWRAHPAFAAPGAWTDDVAEYVRYDLTGEPPALRSRVSADAVRGDSEDTLVPGKVAEWVAAVDAPAEFLGAERGMFDQPEPLYPDAVVEQARAELVPHLVASRVAGVNHYTILLGEHGAEAVAGAVRRALSSTPSTEVAR